MLMHCKKNSPFLNGNGTGLSALAREANLDYVLTNSPILQGIDYVRFGKNCIRLGDKTYPITKDLDFSCRNLGLVNQWVVYTR